MSAVIEVRAYRSKPGMRARLFDLLRSRAVWLRGFPDEDNREPLKAAFYEGAEWLGGLEAEIVTADEA